MLAWKKSAAGKVLPKSPIKYVEKGTKAIKRSHSTVIHQSP